MTMKREKGVATTVCPGCRAERAAVQLPDGGVAVGPCQECNPAPKSEVATYVPRREFGVDEAETDETPEEVSEDDDE